MCFYTFAICRRKLCCSYCNSAQQLLLLLWGIFIFRFSLCKIYELCTNKSYKKNNKYTKQLWYKFEFFIWTNIWLILYIKFKAEGDCSQLYLHTYKYSHTYVCMYTFSNLRQHDDSLKCKQIHIVDFLLLLYNM